MQGKHIWIIYLFEFLVPNMSMFNHISRTFKVFQSYIYVYVNIYVQLPIFTKWFPYLGHWSAWFLSPGLPPQCLRFIWLPKMRTKRKGVPQNLPKFVHFTIKTYGFDGFGDQVWSSPLKFNKKWGEMRRIDPTAATIVGSFRWVVVTWRANDEKWWFRLGLHRLVTV
jgi:hypothetical protein